MSYTTLAAEKRQCPCCRCEVKGDGILDATEVPEAARGKQFCPPSPKSEAQTQIKSTSKGNSPSHPAALAIEARVGPQTRYDGTSGSGPSQPSQAFSNTPGRGRSGNIPHPPPRYAQSMSLHGSPLISQTTGAPIVSAQLVVVPVPPPIESRRHAGVVNVVLWVSLLCGGLFLLLWWLT